MKTISSIAFAAMLTFVPSLAQAENFVLVHGAFQEASGWHSVSQLLEDQGHTVVAVNLPGRDAEGEAAKSITLQSYIDTTTEAVKALDERVILIGHSFGGMTISGVAEAEPDRIEKLIYLAAYIPESGESMEKLALSDKDNRFEEATFVIAKDYSHATLLEDHQVRVFAQDATSDQAAQLQASMVREPLAPIASPIMLSEEKFGSVEKAYIRTLEDGTVSTPLQTMMIERAGISEVRDINSGHAPYLTQPKALVDAILELVD